MLFLIRRLRKSGLGAASAEIRRKYGVISGGVGIGLNLLLFAGKLFVALLSGSVAVLADSFNNLSDAGSSLITLVGFKLSGKKPDSEHPFGHGRMEYITGFIVSILIILMGIELGKSSIESIINPKALSLGTAAIVTLSISVVVKLYMALYNNRLYKVFNSPSLKATAMDSLSDAVSTTAVLLALLISKYTGLLLDGYAGIIVSAFILYTGISTARETISPLLGKPPSPELVEQIEKIVNESSPIIGMHDLVVHDYGPGRLMISLHAEVPSNIDVFAAHEVIDDLEEKLGAVLGCEAVIHFDPLDVSDENLKRMRIIVEEVAAEIDIRLNVHDFRSVSGEGHTNLIFDVAIPFDLEKSENEIKQEISAAISEKLPNHNCVIKVERPRLGRGT